jgi:hypothetical protein
MNLGSQKNLEQVRSATKDRSLKVVSVQFDSARLWILRDCAEDSRRAEVKVVQLSADVSSHMILSKI